jgi:quercetin dioxygenase-like cupin family protein
MARDYDRSAISSVYNLENVAPRRQEPGFEQVVFRGIDQLVGFSQIGPDTEAFTRHTHPYEQLNLLVGARLDFLVDGERVELYPYDTLVIPPEIPHPSRAVDGERATLLALWALRGDRIEGTSYQKEFPAR